MRRTELSVGIAQCIGCGCDDLYACMPNACSWLVVNRATGRGVCSSCPQFLPTFEIINQRSVAMMPGMSQ